MGWHLVTSSIYARVASDATGKVYYKEFLPRSPLETVKAALRGSRATRARKNNDALRIAGFNAPENLAWGKLPKRREYLFSSAVPGMGVTHWLRHELVQRSDEPLRLRRKLLHSLGAFVGTLHAEGFIHGDLRSSNVLADYHEGKFRFSLIDNERNTRGLPPPGRAVLKNLMQLNMLLPEDITCTDRMRFFCNWRRQQPHLNSIEADILARESYHWAVKRLEAKGKWPH